MNREEIIKELKEISLGTPWGLQDRLKLFITKLEALPKEPKQRTGKQNSSLWLFFTLLAEALNNAGYGQKAVFQKTNYYDIPNTKDSVHDLWVYFQKAMYKTNSTTKLNKQEQIEEIHKVVMKNVGEIFKIEYIDFPSSTKIDQRTDAISMSQEVAYPENDTEITAF